MPEQRVCKGCGNTTLWSRGWKCRNCSTVHDGTEAPAACGCGWSDFYELEKVWDDITFYCADCNLRPSRGVLNGSKGYPYFDRGLGRQITSPAHRLSVCRELGVVPTDGETRGTWEEIGEHEQSAIARDEAKYDAYIKEMTEGPSRGQFARLQEHMVEVHREAMAQAREEFAAERRQWESEVEQARSRGRR